MTSFHDDPQQDPFGDALDSPFKNALTIKMEAMHPNDPTRRLIQEQLDALATVDAYLIGAEDVRAVAKPRVTGELQSIFDRLEETFGDELDELRGGEDEEGLLTEVAETVHDEMVEQLIEAVEPPDASDDEDEFAFKPEFDLDVGSE